MPLTFFSLLLIYIDIKKKKKNDKKGANKTGSRKGEVNSKKDNSKAAILNRFASEYKTSTVLAI